VWGGALMSVGALLFPLSQDVPTLYGTRFLVGLGGSLMFLSVVKELDMQFSDRNFSIALSSSLVAAYVGGLVATKPLAWSVELFGWRTALFAVGVGCTVTVAATAVLVARTGANRRPVPIMPIWPALKDIARNRRTYPLVTTAAIVWASYFLMQAIIGKKFLEDCRGLSSSSAAAYTFVMMLTSMAIAVVSGFVPRLIGERRKPILIGSSVLLILGYLMALAIIGGNDALILPCYVLFGLTAVSSPICSASMKELNHPDFAASSIGLMNAAVYMLVSVAASAAGMALDLYRAGARITPEAVRYPPAAYHAIFMVCLVFAVIALVAAFLTRETHGRNVWGEVGQALRRGGLRPGREGGRIAHP
jgi:predicted MFS family arabinose efflux permease